MPISHSLFLNVLQATVREKAIKDTKAKNPNAFKPRIGGNIQPGAVAVAAAQTGHNMGCRCKRSECLKKYCECFQAGVMCGGKCKCKDCMNFAGSQKLIDKRRKIKDQRGAELAMKASDQNWKGQQQQQSARKLPIARPAVHGMRPMPSPVATPGGRMPMANPNIMNPSPSAHPGAPHYHMRPPFMHPHYAHMGYSPMGMHPHHMSPPAFRMYPPPPPPPAPTSLATKRSPASSATKSTGSSAAKPVSAEKATPSSKATPPSKTAVCSPPAKVSKNTETPPKDGMQKSTEKTPKQSPVVKAESPMEEEESIKSFPERNDTQKQTSGVASTPTVNKEDDGEASPESSDRRKSPVDPTPNAKASHKVKSDNTVQPTPSERPALSHVVKVTPGSAIRVAYDASSSRKKRKVGDSPEPTEAYFGTLPEQPKTTILAVFSYLSNSDLTGVAGLVCRKWNELSKDEALWNFQS